MMVEKEGGALENNEFGTLWELWVAKDGNKRFVYSHRSNFEAQGSNLREDAICRYRNKVSGTIQVTKPFLCLGGLLADVSE